MTGKAPTLGSIEKAPGNGRQPRVVWRYQGTRQRLTVDSVAEGERVRRWLGRNGARHQDDPDLLFAFRKGQRPSARQPVLLREALAAFTNRPRLRERTRARYAHDATYFDAIADLPLHRLTTGDLEDILEPLAARLASTTMSGVGGVIAGALRPHGLAGLVDQRFTKPGRRRRQPQVLSWATMGLLADLGDEHGIGDLLRVLSWTGCRFGEGVALRREHAFALDSDHAFIRVSQQFGSNYVRRGVPRTPEEVKTAAGEREIPVGLSFAHWLADRPAGLLTSHPRRPGEPWQHEIARHRMGKVNQAAIRAGLLLTPVNFHDLRHSWGNHLLTTPGCSLADVSKWLGHANVRVTAGIYHQATVTGMSAARDAMK